MISASEKVIQLRQLLAERFGRHETIEGEEVFVTGCKGLDEVGLPKGALTEIVSDSGTGPGGGLLLHGLLHSILLKGDRVALIDGKKTFYPKGLPQEELNRLLWMRCQDAWEAVKAADLTIRDGNMLLVVMVLTLNPSGELRRIPANAWHRLQMLAEKSGVTFLVFTPLAQIGCARLRISASGAFPLDKLHIRRDELLSSLSVRIDRRRVERRMDETVCRASCS